MSIAQICYAGLFSEILIPFQLTEFIRERKLKKSSWQKESYVVKSSYDFPEGVIRDFRNNIEMKTELLKQGVLQ